MSTIIFDTRTLTELHWIHDRYCRYKCIVFVKLAKWIRKNYCGLPMDSNDDSVQQRNLRNILDIIMSENVDLFEELRHKFLHSNSLQTFNTDKMIAFKAIYFTLSDGAKFNHPAVKKINLEYDYHYIQNYISKLNSMWSLNYTYYHPSLATVIDSIEYHCRERLDRENGTPNSEQDT